MNDGDQWSAEELRAVVAAKQAELDEALAGTGGDREQAMQVLVEKARRGEHVRKWHPDRLELVPGIPPWHPEADDDDDPPEGGVREPRRPTPGAPSSAQALEEPSKE